MNWELLVSGGTVAFAIAGGAATVVFKMGVIIAKLEGLEKAFIEHKNEFKTEQRNTDERVQRIYERIERMST